MLNCADIVGNSVGSKDNLSNLIPSCVPLMSPILVPLSKWITPFGVSILPVVPKVSLYL